MRLTLKIIGVSALITLGLGVLALDEQGSAPPPQETGNVPGLEIPVAASNAEPTTVSTSDMRVYRDPSTGRLGPPPPGTELPFDELRIDSFSQEDLEEVESPTAGGGVMVHLKGRFQNVMTASQEHHQLTTDCAENHESED